MRPGFQRLRLQLLAVASIGVLFAAAWLLGLRVYMPDSAAAIFCVKHYVGPLAFGLVAAGISWPVWMISTRPARRNLVRETVMSLADLAAFSVVLFVHFNLKLWSHLVSARNYDVDFQRVDSAMAPLRDWMIEVARVVTPLIPLEQPYMELFISMFLLSFVVHGAAGGQRELRPLLMSTSLVLVFGGLAYWIAPAYGPMVFGMPDLKFVRYMRDFSDNFVASRGSAYDPVKFISMLAAMPSLHVANSAVMTYYAMKWRPVLLAYHVPCTLYFLCQGVALRFHYLIDYPAGLILAGICVMFINGQKLETRWSD